MMVSEIILLNRNEFIIMKKLILKLMMGIFSLFIMTHSNADESELSKMVNPEIKKFMRQQGIPGVALAIYRHGKVYPYYFGYVSKRQKTPVTGKTIFELGSITKTFTSLLLAEEIQRDQLQLSDSIGPYLPSRSDTDSIKQINFLELATHTSALPFNAPHIPYNAKATMDMKLKLQQFLQNWQAPYTPGTQSLYSNLGFGLLGIALAERNHSDLAVLMREKVLSPLHMFHTGLSIAKNDQKYYAQGYTALGKPATSPQSGLLASAWAMKTSIDDMQYYLKAALLTPDTPLGIRQAMRLTQRGYLKVLGKRNYDAGLGWVIVSLRGLKYQDLFHKSVHFPHIPVLVQKISAPKFDDNTLIDKTGTTDGFRSYMILLPGQQEGMVILINRCISDRWALPNLARKILFRIS